MKIGIIFIIIVLIILLFNYKGEHFDQRIDNTTYEQCGILSTKVLNTYGFAYDSENKYCYVSKDPITFATQKQAYSMAYNRKFPRCNKIMKISDPLYNSRNDIIKNAVYSCKTSEEDINPTYKMFDDRQHDNVDISNYNAIDIKPYSFTEIDWDELLANNTRLLNPNIKIDDTHVDDFFYNGVYDNIRQPLESIKEPNNKKYVPFKMGPIDLTKNMQLITNPTPTNSVNIMKEYDEDFLGQYLFPHKCSGNIPKDICLKQCLDDKNCVGTEWNPVSINKDGVMDRGVCCPKIKINGLKQRTKENEFGHFYLKVPTIKNNINTDSLITDNSKTQNITLDNVNNTLTPFYYNKY